MKKILLSANCLLAAVMANAQSPAFEWARGMGAATDDYGYGIAADASGNVYTTGRFTGTVDFDPGPGIFNLTAASTDIFISKLNASGNFVWAKNIGGTSADEGYSIAIDASGNVYTTGVFRGTVDFDPGTAIYNLTSGSFSTDIFILKLDASGNFIWAKNIGGTSSADVGSASSISIDVSGNVLTTGYFWGTVDFDPAAGTFNLNTPGTDRDIFISKLDASGNFVWAKQIGGNSPDEGYSIARDAAGNVYTTGVFYQTADFDPGPGTFNLISAGGNYDMFVLKLDASGNFLWAKNMGGTTDDRGWSVAVDAAGDVYTTGWFEGTADFDPDTATNFYLTSAGLYDMFISKLNASGNFVWAKRIGGTGTDIGYSIAADASGNMYVTGPFQGTVDFDPDAAAFNLTYSGSSDMFILSLDNLGNFVWAKNMGGTKNCTGLSIALDLSNNVYTTGIFHGTVDFNPDSGIFNLTSVGNFMYYDFFVHKMSQCISPSATITPGGSTSFCSGGNVVLSANIGAGLNYQWKLNTANISGATNSTYTATAVGSYTVVVSNPCGTATSSVTTVTVNSLPSATITPAGPTTFCSGGSVVLNAPVAVNRYYQWKKGVNLISGATLSSYTATTGGSYKVIVTNTVTGCSKTTASATVVTVNALASATITPQGPTTFCTGGSVVLQANTGAGLTYKWKKGSNFISGATLSNYTATTGGNYKVQVTNSNGCSKTSGNVAVSVPCKEGESEKVRKWESEMNVSVFPNPNSGEFTIKFSTKPTSPIQIELTDELGKVVKRFEAYDETVVIKETNLANGIYCLRVRNNKKVLIRKINIVK